MESENDGYGHGFSALLGASAGSTASFANSVTANLAQSYSLTASTFAPSVTPLLTDGSALQVSSLNQTVNPLAESISVNAANNPLNQSVAPSSSTAQGALSIDQSISSAAATDTDGSALAIERALTAINSGTLTPIVLADIVALLGQFNLGVQHLAVLRQGITRV